MSNVRNWASGLGMATLILLAPIIGFAVVVTAEMMTDALARPGAPVVWTVVAGAVGWVLLRKYARQPSPSRLGPEGA